MSGGSRPAADARRSAEALASLLNDRRAVTARLARLRADHDGIVAAALDSNGDDEHDPEGATIAFEREQVATLVRQAQRQLEAIDATLVRLQDGSYGRCQRCGSSIPAARMQVRPTAVTCVQCPG